MTPEEFSEEYDAIYEEAKELFEKYNYCDVSHGQCANFKFRPDRGYSFCCSGCEHLSENGCTVKALWCKLWTCRYEKSRWAVSADKQDKLKAVGEKLVPFLQELSLLGHRANRLFNDVRHNNMRGRWLDTFRKSKEQIMDQVFGENQERKAS